MKSRGFAERQIRAFGIVARKAEGHGQDRHARSVIELLWRHTHPVAQTVARGVCERLTTVVHPHPRRLPRDQQPRTRADPDHRTRAMTRRRLRKSLRTDTAYR